MNKLARQRAFEILGKHCPNGLDMDSVIDAVTEGLEEFPPATHGESSTNSPPGSAHWFNTIMGKHLRTGEFLKDKLPSEETVKEWGQTLFDTSKEVIDWFESLGQKEPRVPVESCEYFDNAQGREYCTNHQIETKRCVGSKCGHYEIKKHR